MLTDDVVISMPPEPPSGTAAATAIGAFLRARLVMRGGPWRFVATGANGQPAVAGYFAGGEGTGAGWVRRGLLVIGGGR